MKEGDGIVQPVGIVRLAEPLRYAVGEIIEKERKKNVKILLNLSSRHFVKVLVEMVK